MPSSRHARGHKGNIAPPSSRMLKPSLPYRVKQYSECLPCSRGYQAVAEAEQWPQFSRERKNDWWLLTGTWHGRKIWMSQRRHVTHSQRSICLVKVRERQRCRYVTSVRAAEFDGAGWLGRIKMCIDSTLQEAFSRSFMKLNAFYTKYYTAYAHLHFF